MNRKRALERKYRVKLDYYPVHGWFFADTRRSYVDWKLCRRLGFYCYLMTRIFNFVSPVYLYLGNTLEEAEGELREMRAAEERRARDTLHIM